MNASERRAARKAARAAGRPLTGELANGYTCQIVERKEDQ